MATNRKYSAISTQSTDTQLPSEGQFFAKRGRTNSPPLSRAVFYDPFKEKLEVRRGKNVDLNKYRKIKIRTSNRLVTIFVDAETESEPTTESVGSNGRSNPVLTRLHLDRVGWYCQTLRRAHLLSTCYVRNEPSSPDESPADTKVAEVECAA